MDKKTIFLDIDGTIMTFQGEMPESAKQALMLAKEAGHSLVLCSGRTKSEIYPELLAMDFDGIIGAAGAYVEHRGEVVHRHVVEAGQLVKMIDYFESHDLTYCLQTGEGVIFTSKNRKRFRDYFLSVGLKEETIWKVLSAEIIEENDSRDRMNVEKAAYYGASVCAEDIQRGIGDYFKVDGASYGNNTVTNGEITCNGETKATGMAYYLQHTGGSIEDTIAVGDGLNDMDMLHKAKLAIAMGNGKPETKEIADYITDHVDKDGLFNAFKHFGLI